MENKNTVKYCKAIVIFLAMLYVALSYFPCAIKTNTGGETVSTERIFSWKILIFAALQILLLYLNRPVLQMLAGWCAAVSGIFYPAVIKMQNVLYGDIYYCRAPDSGGESYLYSMTGVGWTVAGISWVLIVLDVVLAVVMHRQKKQCAQQTAEIVEE